MWPDGEVLGLWHSQYQSMAKELRLTRAAQLWDTICPGVAD